MSHHRDEQPRRSWLEQWREARVAGLVGETARAASTVQWFLVLAIVLTASYTIVDAVHDADALADVIVINVACAIGYAIALVLVRTGHQLGAAVLALSIATIQVVWATAVIGWEAGFHLFLLGGGQLVFLIFTARQRALRGVFLAVALGSFLYCQLGLTPDGEGVGFDATMRTVFFSLNAVATALIMFALAAVSYTRAAQAQREATANAERAEFLANTDALTGLANRRPIMEHLQELAAAGTTYAVALADIDHFKSLNDEHGHACGDRVLASLGDRLRTILRSSDSVGRWGGEEFIFVLPQASLADASTLMERVRAAVHGHQVPCSGHDHQVTVSVGVADATAASVVHRVVRRADDALYEAKEGGRDQVRALRAVDDESRPTTTEVAPDPLLNGDRGPRRRVT